MLFTAYFISYNALKQKEIFPKEKYRDEIITINTTEANNQISAKRKLVSDSELIEFKSQLIHLVTEEELYLNHEINLASLSEKLEVTPHQLSYILNNGLKQNFFQFINSYRVERAKVLLLKKSSEKLTILGIAYASGFSSKTAFNTTFKKFTNQTPSQYKKQHSVL
ncbi:helix-turn-helix domain-containing protein [Tenacibaculum amylolyticum]|uniref:helix-turn-helix domain-containing protein n=1 Tax=Tenacibaculum amylolyticum TaxID=104269 RepID=UPI0038B539E3